MPIASSDLIMLFSTTSGSAGYSTSSTAINSLGKYASTSTWSGSTINDLLPDLTAAQNAASAVDYRCVFILNNHATLTLYSATVWIDSQVSSGADIAIGLDPAGITTKTSASAQAATIANINTAPAGVSFSAPTTLGTGLTIGDLGPGQVAGIWIRRTANNTVALANDGAVIKVAGQTPP